jgi:hypothetical protein
MPSLAMQDVLGLLRKQQQASAGQAPPPLAGGASPSPRPRR